MDLVSTAGPAMSESRHEDVSNTWRLLHGLPLSSPDGSPEHFPLTTSPLHCRSEIISYNSCQPMVTVPQPIPNPTHQEDGVLESNLSAHVELRSRQGEQEIYFEGKLALSPYREASILASYLKRNLPLYRKPSSKVDVVIRNSATAERSTAPVETVGQERRDAMMREHILPASQPFCGETKDIDLLKQTPSLRSSPWYASPSEQLWASTLGEANTPLSAILFGTHARIIEDDESLFKDIIKNDGCLLGKVAFLNGRNRPKTNQEVKFTIMMIRNLAMNQISWSLVSSILGYRPIPFKRAFMEHCGPDETTQRFVEYSKSWQERVSKFISSKQEYDKEAHANIEDPSSALKKLDVNYSLLHAYARASQSKDALNAWANFILAALGLRALGMVCSFRFLSSARMMIYG